MSVFLSPEQRASATWQIVKLYCEDRMRELRSKLETNLTFEQTQCVREQLRELRRLLEIETPTETGEE